MLDPAEVTYTVTCEPETTPLRGNCLASGDDAADEQTARDIEEQLEAGNEWAWCCIKVTASWNGIEQSDYLGGCSYKSEQDFIECNDYYADMKDQALQLLRDVIPESGDEIIVREEVNYKVASVDMEAKTVTVDDGRTVPWEDIERCLPDLTDGNGVES